LIARHAADLYAGYGELRARDPIHETARGVWLLTRYHDVCSVLHDPRFGRSGFIEMIAPRIHAAETFASPMRFQDPPGYTRLRGLVGKVFTSSLVHGLRPRIQRVVDELLDGHLRAGGMDVIGDFGLPLSVQVILELLGVPGRDRERFQQWSRDMTESVGEATSGSDAAARGIAAQQAVIDYFRVLIERRRKHPRADVVTRLIAAELSGDKLREFELLDICGLLFFAGHATTVNLIANALFCLLIRPAELSQLRRNPGLLAHAVEEVLRYESPIQRIGRMASTDVELRGRVIPKGAVVSAMLGAANRDPEQFAEPDRLDISRRPNAHMAFGHGAHICMGAPLARLEAKIAIGTMLRRLPSLALDEDWPQWRDSVETRALRHLRVGF
jgi:cytochrome P450